MRGYSMPLKSPVLSLVIPEDLLKRVDDYRFKNRFKFRNEAIRYLIEYALDRLEKEEDPDSKKED